MNTVYIISKYVTVIGSLLKGFWEHVFCRITKTAVSDARYLQATELCGHVEHDFTHKKALTFFLCYIPGFLNRLFGYGMLIGSYLGLFYLKTDSGNIMFFIYVVMLWLGISLMCNNAPLYEDALNNWDLIYSEKSGTNPVFKILAFIPSAYFIISAFMEKYAISLLIYIAAVVIGVTVL